MKQYLEMLKHVRENGVFKSDRTGTGTFSVFAYQMRFDLSNGQFPLVTTKKTHLKSIIHELLWFLQGSTNIRYLKENGVKIWDEWSVKESEFGENFENRELVYVAPRIVPETNNYSPIFDIDNNLELHLKLKATWRGMISRCYDKTAHNYKYYGAVGVFVCDRWQTYSAFVEDVQKLPNWKHKLSDWENYNLDKDYYSSNCYSPETCLWLSKVENCTYGDCSPMIVITPAGHSEIYPSINDAAKKLGIARNTLHRFGERVPDILKGRNKVYKGWKFIVIDAPFRYDFPKVGDLGPVYGSQWRSWGAGKISAKTITNIVDTSTCDLDMATKLYNLFKNRKEQGGIDQIAILIDQLTRNPDSRRLIVSAWNPAEVDNMALPPCHTMFQFYSNFLSMDELEQVIGQAGKKSEYLASTRGKDLETDDEFYDNALMFCQEHDLPRRKLSCQLYQRKHNCALVA